MIEAGADPDRHERRRPDRPGRLISITVWRHLGRTQPRRWLFSVPPRRRGQRPKQAGIMERGRGSEAAGAIRRSSRTFS